MVGEMKTLGCIEPKKELLSISQQGERLDEAVSTLSDAISGLRARLAPVSQAESQETGCDAPVDTSNCPLANDLSGIVARVRREADIVANIISRLEL